MKKSLKSSLFLATMGLMMAAPAFAQEAAAAVPHKGSSGISFYIIVAISTAFGASLAQSGAIKSAVEGIARNPGASGKILPTLLIGLAMIESLAIYVLVIALILIFANPFLKFIS